MKLKYTDIIIAPLVTEKSTDLKDKERLLCFKVHKNSNKINIKKAVEELFKTEVESVRVMNFRGKEKRFGRYTGKRPSWKKAYVKLKKDAKMVEYFEV
ncbi:MAG: 50S ribosomal protein L23 [Candidatus Aminicenantes bacterium]|nr:50S ribosomal protein L23 [Candidatus Aminicenantes bacterium]NIM81527.1 50S ribosomal protein L23 [Candidatus Aminicenantes bacterium]NIN20898.1 50S ribosomal protein L23 [Candidatus Aminicenantes bacterium]NIN44719.1 50S ribosomal protein L23 [Candidatus Aminicenantes bacterium]NIN87527.1 50S ribosomal protein L23 [Candidatus Aminicenantes bacterium]